MAEVLLSIGDRQHRIACKDGTEDEFRRIATKLDARWTSAERASGGRNSERTMLFVALMLADALDEAERQPRGTATPQAIPGDDPVLPDLNRLAERLEAIANTLENLSQSA